MRQHLAAHAVDLRGGQRQAGVDDAAHGAGGIGRAAGFGKAGGKLVLRQRAPFGVLRNGPLRLADVAVGILHGEHGVLPVRDDGVKIHRHALGLEIFIRCAGGGKQLAVRPLRLARAEHLRACAAEVIALREALAGERGAQRGKIRRADLAAVERGAVDARDDGDILRALHAALELEAGHAHAGKLAEVADEAIVLQAHGIAVFKPAVAVGQAAGLGALAAVAGAAADDGRHIALAGIAHAQRTVDEDLDAHGAVAADIGDLLARQLAREHHARKAERGKLAHALERVHRELGGGMQRQLRGDLAGKGRHAEVLHDEGVDACAGRGRDMLRDLRQLAVRDEGIERQVDPHAAHMAVAHRLRQLVQCEIARTCAGIEPLRAQIDRIGTVADGGVQRIKGPGGGEQFEHGGNSVYQHSGISREKSVNSMHIMHTENEIQ